MKTLIESDIDALRKLLAGVKAKQERYFQQHHKLLTPFDGEFWALTQAIYDRQLCAS